MPASNVIAVDFRPPPFVQRATFDSTSREWTFTVTRERCDTLPPSPTDVPLEVRDALRTFAGEHTKIGPAA